MDGTHKVKQITGINYMYFEIFFQENILNQNIKMLEKSIIMKYLFMPGKQFLICFKYFNLSLYLFIF